MTQAEKETRKHILMVQQILQIVCNRLEERGLAHDRSKLDDPEAPIFEEYTDKLAGLTYGSEEYRQCLAGMKPALDHHYVNNRHHPEFHPDVPCRTQVSFMNLIDLVEMVCDWKAATLRHNDGDFKKSVLINTKRFNLSEQLAQIILNTAVVFDGEQQGH